MRQRHDIDPKIGPRGVCRLCSRTVEQIAEGLGVHPREGRFISEAACPGRASLFSKRVTRIDERN